MYAKDKPATLDITLDQYDLDLQWQSSPSLTVDYVYQNAAAGQVQLSWSRIKGDDDVYGGAPYSSGVTYNVWKRETALNEDNLGKVTGDWIKVEYTIVEPGDGDTSNTIYAKETAAVNSFLGKWEYVVYASAAKGSKTSHSRPLTATLNRTLPAEAAINGSPAVAYGGTADPYTIRISATGLTAGVSYKLYRGELIPLLTKDDGTWNTNPVTAVTDYQFAGYDTAPVHTWTGQAIPGDTTAAIYDTGIAPRKSYLYKLVSSLGDTLLGDGATGYIIPNSTASPASVYSNLELTVNPLSGGRDSDQRGYIGASVSNSGYTKDMDVRLFYRRANATPGTIPPGTTETGWTQLAVFDKTTVGAGLTFNSLTVPVPNPVYGEIYRFMAVAYLDNKPIPNLSQDSYSGAVVDNGEEDSSLLSQTRITGLTSTELGLGSAAGQTITGIDGEFLKGAQINVRIVLSGVSTYEQPAPFNLEVMPSNPLRYQVTLSLTNRPNANGYTSYSVEWKYPWEKWEAITSPRVIQSNIIY
jgi:hypothetical protein